MKTEVHIVTGRPSRDHFFPNPMKSKSFVSRLLVIPSVGLLAVSAAKAEKHALLVAIDDYSGVPGASDLPGCGDDLAGVRNLLISRFEFPAANVKSLLDGKATKAAVLGELDGLVKRAKPGDSVVFYYSGHGGQVPDLNDDDEGDGLDEALITSDFDVENQSSWLLDDHLRATLSQLKTKRTLILIDACHSGTGTRGRTINKKADLGLAKMLGRGRIDKAEIGESGSGPATHVLISGCAANEVSALGLFDGKRGSLFTMALLNVIPDNLSVPLPQLRTALYSEMTRLAPDVAPEQRPQLETALNATFQDLLGEITPGADAGEAASPEPVQLPSDGLPTAFPVKVVADQRSYMPDELMVATVVSERAGYLRLYYVDKTGDATLIFPNHFQRDNRISAEQRVEVGGEEAAFRFRMKAPSGTEMLLAAVSESQFTDADALGFSAENPVKAMGKVDSVRKLLDTGTKAIVVEGAGSAVTAPAQIGRAVCFYEIKEAAKAAAEIVKAIQVEGRVGFDEQALPFKFDSTDLASDAATAQVAQISRALQSPQLQKLKFVIEGHTCDMGEDAYNLELSKRRAAAIQNLLLRAGIGAERITIEGSGETKPVQQGSSDEVRIKNRRVELRLAE
jgi:outer membrane protein OmpA-like peptidoglycan-associated protein